MRAAGFAFGVLLSVLVLDACQPPRPPTGRRARELHRVVLGRP